MCSQSKKKKQVVYIRTNVQTCIHKYSTYIRTYTCSPCGVDRCMVHVHVCMHGTNSCVHAWYKFMCACMVQDHVCMHGTSSCVHAWYTFMCACMVQVHVWNI